VAPAAWPPALFVTGPQAQDFDDFFLFENFVDQPVLNIDGPGIGAGKVPHQFLKPRRSVERVFPDDF
jgi:hypothetical protein